MNSFRLADLAEVVPAPPRTTTRLTNGPFNGPRFDCTVSATGAGIPRVCLGDLLSDPGRPRYSKQHQDLRTISLLAARSMSNT
jgi:hypothetical protein